MSRNKEKSLNGADTGMAIRPRQAVDIYDDNLC